MTILTRFDTMATKRIGTLPKWLHAYFDALGYMTMPIVWFGVVVITVIYKYASGMHVVSDIFLLACIPVATVLKLFIRRKRPMTIYAEAMKVKSYSFPSSHAYSVALTGGYFASIAFTNGLPFIGILFVLLILLVGVSRVHLGAHYPSDVLAGWVLGGCLLLGILHF